MTFRSYITIMLVSTLVAWAAWLLVLFRTDPQQTTAFGFLLFYVSLLLGLMGIFALFGLVFRHLKVRKKFLEEKVVDSFRQGFWLAAVIIAALILESRDLLTWWNALLIVLVVTVLEFFFVSAASNKENKKVKHNINHYI